MPAQRTLLNEETLVPWILRYLGAPFVKVELGCEHIEDAIEEAKRWYTAKKGFRKVMFWDVVSGVSEYQLPEEVEIVIDVAFSGTGTSAEQLASGGFGAGFGTVDIFGGFTSVGGGCQITGYSGAAGGFGPLASYTLALQNLDMLKKVFSGELDWRQDNRTLRLFPVNGYKTGQIFIEYKANMLTIEQLSERDHDLVKRFALMASKKRLGRIRSKYPGGFPTAQGNADLDGATLLDEARQEEEKLETEVSESGFPMGFTLG